MMFKTLAVTAAVCFFGGVVLMSASYVDAVMLLLVVLIVGGGCVAILAAADLARGADGEQQKNKPGRLADVRDSGVVSRRAGGHVSSG
jgi:hypothetical protein